MDERGREGSCRAGRLVSLDDVITVDAEIYDLSMESKLTLTLKPSESHSLDSDTIVETCSDIVSSYLNEQGPRVDERRSGRSAAHMFWIAVSSTSTLELDIEHPLVPIYLLIKA
jgi:hypothetical protein